MYAYHIFFWEKGGKEDFMAFTSLLFSGFVLGNGALSGNVRCANGYLMRGMEIMAQGNAVQFSEAREGRRGYEREKKKKFSINDEDKVM